jgi:hypothetical protein
LPGGKLIGQEAVHQGGLAYVSGTGDHDSHAEELSWCIIGSLELSEVGEDLFVGLAREFGWQRERLDVLVEMDATVERDEERDRDEKAGVKQPLHDISDGLVDLKSLNDLLGSDRTKIITTQPDSEIERDR